MVSSGSKIRRHPTQKPNILIISQPATPDMHTLPGTLDEAKAIQDCASPEYVTHLTHDQATTTSVMSEMSKHEIIHLACHGIQDLKDPLGSSFILYDGELKLRSLMGLSLDNPKLAVLSACQTATGNETLPGEAVHLAAGMLAVGYPSVIATMWSIEDEVAPRVAAEVYGRLLGNQDRNEGKDEVRLSSAYALHEAMKHLRQDVGEMNFAQWVPFVHFGV